MPKFAYRGKLPADRDVEGMCVIDNTGAGRGDQEKRKYAKRVCGQLPICQSPKDDGVGDLAVRVGRRSDAKPETDGALTGPDFLGLIDNHAKVVAIFQRGSRKDHEAVCPGQAIFTVLVYCLTCNISFWLDITREDYLKLADSDRQRKQAKLPLV